MVGISWGPGRLWREYNAQSTNWSYFSVCDVCDDIFRISRISFWRATTPPWLLDESNASCEYAIQYICCLWVCVLTYFPLLTCSSILTKKELLGQQQQQLKSSWHLSGLPWHTKHKWFLVMECAAVFLTWKHRLDYCMYFTVTERCYSYRESKTRYYESNWWPMYSVSWVSPGCKTSGLELTLFKVYSCLEAAFFQTSSDFITNILG